jgi:hypothetical protein
MLCEIFCFPKFLAYSMKLDVRMPNIPAVEGIEEIYLCTIVRLPEPDKTLYATQFDPKATKENVHHFVLYGSSEPHILGNGNCQAKKSKTRQFKKLHFEKKDIA